MARNSNIARFDVNDFSIYIPKTPYKVRANCKQGQFATGGLTNRDEMIANGKGDFLEVALVTTKAFHGDLGLTKDSDWVQLWAIVTKAETQNVTSPLKPGLLITMMIKKEGQENVMRAITDMELSQISEDIETSMIYRLEMSSRSGNNGDYFAITVKLRAPETDFEKAMVEGADQLSTLDQILIDSETTKDMVPLDSGDALAMLSEAPEQESVLALPAGKGKGK